ncbi:hypothetical protein BDQ17DRAFT_420130 [Cyathus striatus]|nr:hypothetical protein BDQ17DRAFT_420130 [Cyathus striatus]
MLSRWLATRSHHLLSGRREILSLSRQLPRFLHQQTGWADLYNPPTPTHDVARHYKRLIVCCDGTWRSSYQPDTTPTNVTRLCRAINTSKVNEDGTEIQQVVLYQAGIGATPMGIIQRYLAGGLGFGLDENICEAYQFLANNYEEGDEIFLFGYSRGAYTARAVSGLISNIGLLGKTSLHKFYEIYHEYQKKRNTIESEERWENYVRVVVDELDRQPNVKIKIVGCWDTVGSLGLPETSLVRGLGFNRKYEFHSTQLSTSIENAFHCLALDECRWTFAPTLWYLPREASEDVMPAVVPVPSSKSKSSAQKPPPLLICAPNPSRVKLRQIWMIGVHSDVGGNNHFADIGFKWMIDQCDEMLDFDMNTFARKWSVMHISDKKPPRIKTLDSRRYL